MEICAYFVRFQLASSLVSPSLFPPPPPWVKILLGSCVDTTEPTDLGGQGTMLQRLTTTAGFLRPAHKAGETSWSSAWRTHVSLLSWVPAAEQVQLVSFWSMER